MSSCMDTQTLDTVKKPLRIMKFGGTSVGDATRIRKVVEIIREAARESEVVVVVSAMSGVTNRLIEAASQAKAGNREAVDAIFEELRDRHSAAVSALIHSVEMRSRISRELRLVFEEGERLCQGTALLRELTVRAQDSISSLGERLSAPLVAAALTECSGARRGRRSHATRCNRRLPRMRRSFGGPYAPALRIPTCVRFSTEASFRSSRVSSGPRKKVCLQRSVAAGQTIPRRFWARHSTQMR